jgi:ribonuclease I
VRAGFVVHGLWDQNEALDGYEHLQRPGIRATLGELV